MKAYQFDSKRNGALSLAWQRAAPYMAAARTRGTREVYARAFRRWARWCEAMHTAPIAAAPEAIAAYLAELAAEGKSVASIKGALAAILHRHRLHCHRIDSQAPAIVTVMAGITRRASRPIKRAPACKCASRAYTSYPMSIPVEFPRNVASLPQPSIVTILR